MAEGKADEALAGGCWFDVTDTYSPVGKPPPPPPLEGLHEYLAQAEPQWDPTPVFVTCATEDGISRGTNGWIIDVVS